MTTRVKCDEGTFEVGEPCSPAEAVEEGYWFSAAYEGGEPDYLTRIREGALESWVTGDWHGDTDAFLNPHRAIRVQDKPESRPLDQAARDWMRARPGEVLRGISQEWRWVSNGGFQWKPQDAAGWEESKGVPLSWVSVTPACGSWDIPPAPVESRNLNTPEVRRWMVETGRNLRAEDGLIIYWSEGLYMFCDMRHGMSQPTFFTDLQVTPEDGLPW